MRISKMKITHFVSKFIIIADLRIEGQNSVEKATMAPLTRIIQAA
jgi:hypothetical protein